jgi:hypothetical protein
VAFGKYFPGTVWLWQRLTSRGARRIALLFLLVLALLAMGLRVYSAIFVYRVHTILAGMEQLRPDQTTKAEMLKMVPALHPGQWEYQPYCEGEECYTVLISNWGGFLDRQLEKVGNPFLFKAALLLGLHLWNFGAKVVLGGGRVHDVYYYFIVDDGSGEYPGTICLKASSLRGSNHMVRNLFRDESPDCQISIHHKWPDLNLTVIFAPTAPPEVVHHAFDVHLGCMLGLGCRTARQILPLVWDDKQKIEAAALARMQGSDPCPNRILPRRARDVPNILLADVERVRPGFETSYDQVYQLADYRLLEVLKGAPNVPVKGKGVRHRATILGTYNVPNPALRLLRPGERVLMFTDADGVLVEPCEIVAATPSALQTIRSALASPASQVVESDVGHW